MKNLPETDHTVKTSGDDTRSKYVPLFKYTLFYKRHGPTRRRAPRTLRLSGGQEVGNVIKIITKLKLLILDLKMKNSKIGTILYFKHLKPIQMLCKREQTQTLPEGNAYKDYKDKGT